MKAAKTPKTLLGTGTLRRIGGVLNRAIASASYRFHIAAANSWRDNYNPLRSLGIQRAVSMLEDGERGAYADVQWTYRYIEMQDATLGALVERRTSAIQKLDWSIKLRDSIPKGKEEIAKRQEEALRSAYDRLKNFTDALEFLAMATFRGYAHLEKITDENGDVVELAPVPQWFWVREGLNGDWKYNRQASFGKNQGEAVPLPRFIIREVARPINRVALICFVRKGLSQKDWDGFVESYGIPAIFIVMPPSVPKDKEDAYLAAAENIAGNGRGVLAHGSDVKTVDNGARGVNPFRDHIDYQDEQVVLRGTGGKLTMLSEATGIGGGATDAHSDTFDEIAKAEAAEISETLRRGFDRDVIERVTPGEEAYAYFELAANEETDTSSVVKDLTELNAAGYEVEPGWVEEKTGYPVTLKVTQPATPATVPAPTPAPLLNRQGETEWKRFRRETGTLRIPRELMPQIDSRNRGAVVTFLRKRGIACSREEVKPADLKPSQAEYSPTKATGPADDDRPLLISGDNHVIDGHHQYLRALRAAPNKPVPVFRIKAPAMQVIGTLLAMPSTTTAEMPIRNRSEALADALGVNSEMLEPVSDLIDRLAGDVQGERADDDAWLDALEEAAQRIPELFSEGHAAELAASIESALGGAALRGARDGMRDNQSFQEWVREARNQSEE